jgi:hypothetical protein
MPKIPNCGGISQSWNCIDCGVNTAPGWSTRVEMEKAVLMQEWQSSGVRQQFHPDTEVYMVKPAVWKAAGMRGFDGCLCIGCLERRIGRTLVPADFTRNHAFTKFPGSARLRSRRDGEWSPPES